MSRSDEGAELERLAKDNNLKPLIICAEDGELSPTTLRAIFKGEKTLASSVRRAREAIQRLIAKKNTAKAAG